MQIMIFKKKYIAAQLLLLIVGFSLTSCKKDPVEDPPVVVVNEQLSIQVLPVFGSQTLFLDSTYLTDEGFEIQFTDVKFYGGNWKNGSETLFETAFFDYRNNGNKFARISKKPDSFSALQGLLGVDSSLNHLDPTAFANDNPLNIANAGDMHWSWNPGYIFIKVEARVDTIQDGIPLFDHYAVYHVGTDNFIQNLDFPIVNWTLIGEKSYRANMKLDLHQFLSNAVQPINVKNEFMTHTAAGQEVLTLKAIQNFKSALSFIP
jgi:hypothetical protein